VLDCFCRLTKSGSGIVTKRRFVGGDPRPTWAAYARFGAAMRGTAKRCLSQGAVVPGSS